MIDNPAIYFSNGKVLKVKNSWLVAIVGLGFTALALGARADELNMTPGVTKISRDIYDLHMLIFWICVAIGVVVFGMIFWTLIHHRKSAGYEAVQFHESTTLEIGWTLVPTLILIAMAWPATQSLVAMYDTGGEDMTVEVRAYQWRWQYKYLDDNYDRTFSFFSNLSTPQEQRNNKSVKGEHYLLEVDNALRIPANRKVRFLITSEDVIHAWWVPDFGIKRDAVPGMLNELWTIVEEPGIYRGQCAELCGKDHGFMPIVVEVLAVDEYNAWYTQQLVAEADRVRALSQTFTVAELMTQGEQVYNTFCAACHMPNGQGVPPVFPALDGAAITTGPLDAHLEVVINGQPGTAMQAFGAQLDAAQLAAVVHYERHAWTNNTRDITQPQDVVEFISRAQGGNL